MAMFSEEPYVTAETGVFWDVDDCEIPEELNAAEILPRIRKKLVDFGLRGPVSVRAYGDMTGLHFQSSDIKLNHFQPGERREKMTKMLEDIVAWSGENPQPCVGVLFLGDDLGDADADIAEVLELLRTQKNYKFLIVTPGSDPPPPPPPTVMILTSIPPTPRRRRGGGN